jgi:hypothetical protein
MPEPSEELITTLVEIQNGTRQARASGRLRPLLVVRPHPKRRMGKWGAQATISAALARSKAAAAPLELAHG